MRHLTLALLPLASASLLGSPAFANGSDTSETFAHSPQGTIYTTTILNEGNQQVEVKYEVIDGFAVTDGDIILGKASTQDDTQPLGLAHSALGKRWPNAVIPYAVSNALTSATKSWIQAAIAHWSNNTPMKFVLLDESNKNQYSDYVEFVEGSGCSSYIGRQGGRQPITLSTACSQGNIVHEIGHAIGLYHEHARSDRDEYVQIMWDNIPAERGYNFQKQINGANDIGPYDFGSIMHYGAYAFSNNGEKTIQPINPSNAHIGQRMALSSGDITAVNAMYATDLNLKLLSNTPQVAKQGKFTITGHVTNEGNNNANEISVVVTLPANAYFKGEPSDPSWQCTSTGNNTNKIVYHFGSLNSGQSKSEEIPFESYNSDGTIQFNGQVIAANADVDPSDNNDTVMITVGTGKSNQGVTVSQVADGATLQPGEDYSVIDSQAAYICSSKQDETPDTGGGSSGGGGGTLLYLLGLLLIPLGRQRLRRFHP